MNTRYTNCFFIGFAIGVSPEYKTLLPFFVRQQHKLFNKLIAYIISFYI